MKRNSFVSFVFLGLLFGASVAGTSEYLVQTNENKKGESYGPTSSQRMAWEYDKKALIDPAFGGPMGALQCGFLPDKEVPKTTELSFDDLNKEFARRYPKEAEQFQVLGFAESTTGEV